MAQLSPSRPVLVIAGPGDTQDAILAAVAAQETDAEVLCDVESVGELWRSASTVIIADELAERVAARALPHRDKVFLVGDQTDLLSTWSAPLAAQVIALPGGVAWLGAVVGEGSGRGRAPVITVIGGSGGVGASTFATALAQAAASKGAGGAALVDADPLGGGIDLLLGAEQVAGWRWPRLQAAEGHLGDLRGYLPVVDQISLVSMARGGGVDLAREPLAAIVGSLRSWHSLVVMDPGRSLATIARESVRLSSRQLLLVAAGVRGVAAARQMASGLDLVDAEVVVRRSRGSLPASLIEEALGLPVLAEIPEDSALIGAAEHGIPPGRRAHRGYRKAVERLVDRLAPVGMAGDD